MNVGPHGCSVIAAPPTVDRRSSTVDARTAFGEQAGGDEAVVPAADHDDVERLAHDAARLTGGGFSRRWGRVSGGWAQDRESSTRARASLRDLAQDRPPGVETRDDRGGILGALVGAAELEDRREVGIVGERRELGVGERVALGGSVSVLRTLRVSRYDGSVVTR